MRDKIGDEGDVHVAVAVGDVIVIGREVATQAGKKALRKLNPIGIGAPRSRTSSRLLLSITRRNQHGQYKGEAEWLERRSDAEWQ